MITKEYTLNIGKKAIVIVLRTSAIAVASLLALFFLAQSIATTTTKIAATRNEFATLTAQYSALDRLGQDHEVLKGVMEKLETMTPTVDTVPAVEDFLTGAAVKTNVLLSFTFASFPTPSATETLEELGITLRVEGGEQSLLAFLKMIENAPYLIAIRDISITFADTEGTLSASATGVAYLKKQDL